MSGPQSTDITCQTNSAIWNRDRISEGSGQLQMRAQVSKRGAGARKRQEFKFLGESFPFHPTFNDLQGEA